MSQSESSRSGGQAQAEVVAIQQRSALDEALREGARQMLRKAVEDEVAAYIDAHQDQVDENGRRLVVRNGHARERTLVTGVGTIAVRAPRSGATANDPATTRPASVATVYHAGQSGSETIERPRRPGYQRTMPAFMARNSRMGSAR